MRDERTPPAGDEPPAQDILEHGLLHEVLVRHPAQLTFDELVRMLGEERFLVEDAVAALGAMGCSTATATSSSRAERPCVSTSSPADPRRGSRRPQIVARVRVRRAANGSRNERDPEAQEVPHGTDATLRR